MKKQMRKEENIIVFIGIFIIGIILLFHIVIFNNYKKNLISLQEDHMLNTAKAVANSLKTFYDEKLSSFSLFFHTKRSDDEAEMFFSNQDEITSLIMMDQDGRVETQLGNDYVKWIPEVLSKYQETDEQSAAVLSPILTSEHNYTHFMIKQLITDQKISYVMVSIELPATYELIVKPIQIGKYGYSMVKDLQGIILMHKVTNQIGLDAVKGRKLKYQDYHLDLSGLENLIQEQRINSEGSRILESYWWDDEKDPVRSKKVVAYSHVTIGEEIWIINCTLDYNEIEQPIKMAQQYVFLSSVLLVISFGFLCFWVINNKNRNQRLKMEMVHLQEMNEAWELLHKREEQLRHNDKIQTLGTMTSMISHEFNNYLTPILLYGELLETDAGLTKAQQEYVHEMLESAVRAGELTKELSLYGRTDNINYKKEMIHVVDEIERSISMLKKTVPANIELILELEPVSEYGVLAGKGAINQIIINLTANAIHAMKENGGILSIIGKRFIDGSQSYYAITIKDTGCGMSDIQRKQIFTPFYTTKVAGKGTGVGLSIVNDLIHRISGDIHVISNEGEGTRFDVLLPLSLKQTLDDFLKEEVNNLCNKRILVLDDSEKVGKALYKSLKSECQKINVFQKPEEALAQIKNNIDVWDLVITDYTMPMMNGLEFASILRSLGYHKTIILISGQLEQDIQWYLDCNIIDAFLEKPVSIESIKRVISS